MATGEGAGEDRARADAGPGSGTGDGVPTVRIERQGAVARITLHSPHNRNALSRRLLAELHEALARAGTDAQVRVVVLTATGTTFCSGADLRERLAASGLTTAEEGTGTTAEDRVAPGPAGRPDAPGVPGPAGRPDAPGIPGPAGRPDVPDVPDAPDVPDVPDVLDVIATMPKPVVARVNGHVRAGGMGLVAACDLAVATSAASFAFAEVRVGVAPAIIAVPALRVMVPRLLARYCLTGEVFGAADAVAAGLLSAAVAPEGLDAWVEARVGDLLAASPTAVAATKRLLADLRLRSWREGLQEAGDQSARLFATPDAAEGMRAFLQKRPPSWATGGP